MRKSKYKHLQKLTLANAALIVSLIDEMNRKGLIDGSKVFDEYGNNLEEVIKGLTK